MSVVIVLGALSLFYFFGYRKWSLYIAEKVFGVSADEKTPAHDPQLRDDVDYMPVDKHVLWGHHYTSIAGAAPIIENGVFTVNILRDDQSFVSDTFAGRYGDKGKEKFDCAEWHVGATGAPVLNGAVASFDCKL